MPSVEIPGLVNVRETEGDLTEKPGNLSLRELQNLPEVRFVPKEENILEPEDFNAYLLQIQAMMQWWQTAGQNKKLIGLEDMKIAFVNGDEDDSSVAQDSGAYFVCQSKDTGWYQIFDVNLSEDVTDRNHPYNVNAARGTARAIIALTDEPPVGNEG